MAADGTLAKGVMLLRVLVQCPDGVTVTGLAREVELPVSTVHRLLAEMVRIGLARVDSETRRYELGMTLFELHHLASQARSLPEMMLSVVRRLASNIGRTIFVGAREGANYFYVERLGGNDRIQIKAYIGERVPLHAASGGKCLVAFLSEAEQESIIGDLRWEQLTEYTRVEKDEFRKELRRVAERGYAINDEEIQEGVRAVSVPIMNNGRPVYALTAAGSDSRMPMDSMEVLAGHLHDAAREIELQLPRGEDLPVHGA